MVNKYILKKLLIILTLLPLFQGCNKEQVYLIFDNQLPDTIPKINDWTEPINMGKNINTSGWEMGPSLSPDGKYLFFTRRKSWDTNEPSKIFWVDIAIINVKI